MKVKAVNRGIDEELFKEIIEINESAPYHMLLDIDISCWTKGMAEITTTIQEKHLNPVGNAHGGMAFFAFLTLALGMAVGEPMGRYKHNLSGYGHEF